MRRIIHCISLFVLVAFALPSAAQSGPYGNEWIDYSKTYYKFKVGKNGVHHITRAALTAAGVPGTVLGSNFMLYRDGLEVPIWVSNETMSGTDYIEFIGRKADGLLDKELYGSDSVHSDDRISLFADSATYFLTYDNGISHARYQQAANNIPGSPPPPESYCISTVGNYFKNVFSPGKSHDASYPYYSSFFETGEGLTNGLTGMSAQSLFLATPNAVTGAPVSAMLHTSVITLSYQNTHNVKLYLNNQLVADSSFGVSETRKFDISIPATQLTSNNEIRFIPQGMGFGSYDLYGVSFVELQYPRNYDVTGQDFFPFKLNASSSSQYIEFLNFGSAQNRLYDITNRKWYTGDISVSGKTRFYIQASLLPRDLVLFAFDAGNIPALAPVKNIQFTNYTSAINQGDYVIVTHKKLREGSQDYIQAYKDYRSSADGGLHKVVVADVNELYDEFAYGYDMHPLSIRHFLSYAYHSWSTRPEYAFLIGRGVLYHEYQQYLNNPTLYPMPMVPTYGHPGSDANFTNFDSDQNMKMSIGRLSVWNTQEIANYLTKIKAYEAALKSPSLPTAVSELWKKQVLHVAGSTDITLQLGTLLPALAYAGEIIKDTFTGKVITTTAKSSSNYTDPVNSALIDSLLRSGVSMITFYGHASPTVFDYNLAAPETYSSSPRLPYFLALGCDVAQMFDLSSQRSIAERYVLAPNGGSTVMVAADNISFPSFDNEYLFANYASIATKNYGASIGKHYQSTYNTIYNNDIIFNTNRFDFDFVGLQSMIFAGDPAIQMYGPPKADYHISSTSLSALPATVTTTMDSFRLRIISFNLGKAIHDTVQVKVEHINPLGAVSTVAIYDIPDLYNIDTSFLWVPINKLNDLGVNKYRVTIDPSNKSDELSETNNTSTLDLFIFSDDLVPVYPKEFAIVYKQGVVLKASTLNPFRLNGRYRMELDTTELFNSPLKLQTTIASNGGVIKWTPNLVMKDSIVYYWRTAFDSLSNGNYHWTGSSFIYLAQGSPGWNQSHYYQYTRDNPDSLTLGTDRIFRFGNITNHLQVLNTVLFADADGDYNRIYWNGIRVQRGPQTFMSIQIMVIDSSGQVYYNPPTGGGLPPSDPTKGTWVREFPTSNQASRLAAAHFLDSMPNGSYIMVKNIRWDPSFVGGISPVYASDWKADSNNAIYPGHSLYHSLYSLGFTTIDSFNKEGTFIFMCKKGDPSYPVDQRFSDSAKHHLVGDYDIKSLGYSGKLTSTVIGPAKAWYSLKWQVHAEDGKPQNDKVTVLIYGIDSNNVATLVYTGPLGKTEPGTASRTSLPPDLSFISAKQYPNIQLVWKTYDSLTRTSAQLDFWRVLYSPVPEAALNPAAHFTFSDSLQVGQQEVFSVAIENLTDIGMDSMLVHFKVIDANGITHALPSRRFRPLPGNDTLHAGISFDPAPYPGQNAFFIEANPNNDQPEQFHPNNIGVLPMRIATDRYNPLLDVTFDGIHILDRDIVSAKPFIKIMLKDENKYLVLDDTALLKVSLHYPADPIGYSRPVPFDGSLCRFIPGQAGSDGKKNVAYVEFRPDLVQDGIYELFVTGRDRTGNTSGKSQYQISFEVENKPTVTNVLNYPNPFSTATAFLFTLTGSQIPSQFKIQILSVTGKVVREITRAELGPLHIGRNITEYKWDGRDQFGQLLGNGVYMYRVVTSLNGNDIEHRSENTVDKYFKNGYGKMYIMR